MGQFLPFFQKTKAMKNLWATLLLSAIVGVSFSIIPVIWSDSEEICVENAGILTTYSITIDQWNSNQNGTICGEFLSSTTDQYYQVNNLDVASFQDPIGNPNEQLIAVKMTFLVAACDYEEDTAASNVDNVDVDYPIELNGYQIGTFDPTELPCIYNVCEPEATRYMTYTIDPNLVPYNYGGTNTFDFNFYEFSVANGGLQHICFAKIEVEFTTQPITPTSDAPNSYSFSCVENKKVEAYASGTNFCNNGSNPDAAVTIPSAANTYQTVVEVVYKNEDPGNSVTINGDGINYVIQKVPTAGTSSNIHVYRGLLPGNITTIFTNDIDGNCGSNNGLQSLIAYAFRNVTDGIGQSGVFTAVDGYCDQQTLDIPIPTGSSSRNIVVHVPLSEMTNDGRYLTVEAIAGGQTNSVTIFGPDNTLNQCCVNIVSIPLNNVPASANVVNIKIVTDAANNPNDTNSCGQSYVVAGFLMADIDCPCELAGGDSDDDGICDDEDCAPANPNLPATPGTSCDDGNSDTQNDIIQADG